GNFDPNLQLDFNNNFGPAVINDTLTFVWFNFTGLNLPDNTTIFTVYFDIVGNAGSSSLFEFINTPTTIIEASNSQGVTGVLPFNALINVFDFTPPTIQCPKDVNISIPQGLTGVNVNNIAPVSAKDNCGVKSLSYNYSGSTFGSGNNDASGNFFNNGTTNVTYIVEDFGGNQKSCSFAINIVQDTFQLFTDTIYAECSNGVIQVDVKVKNFTNIASLQFGMNWDGAIIHFDSVGNFQNSLFLSGILQPNSNFGPVVIDDSLTFAWNNYSGITLPDSSIIFSVFFHPVNNITSSSFFNFINYPTTPIEVSVKGNPPYVIPYVVYSGVIIIDDTEPPVLSCPANITVNTDPDACSALVIFNPATAIDNCDPLVNIMPSVPASGSVFLIGTTVVTFTGIDDFNNTGTCTFNVTVVDKQKPVLLCPSDLTTDNDPGECGSTILLPQLLDASDNCDVNVTVSANQPLIHFYPVGNTTVIYTGIDKSGNKGTCSFKIYVNDLELPVINNCPKDTIVVPTINIMNQCFAEVCWPIPNATDNCPNIFLSTTNNPCSLFPPGNTDVIYTVTDESGNTATCSFSVSVQVLNSGFNDCPADITASTTPDTCGAFVSWVEPYFIDACGDTLDVYSNIGPGEFFPLGTTKVVYITVLNSIVLDTCMFNVTVVGQTPFISGCPSDIKLAVLPDTCGNYP
ncbi:MAG TPA: HYR domain-containing protein, partial [Saprospiraceae bacterium]|nr:HYR domain-containing protein [Saprospiraceae bacterium]